MRSRTAFSCEQSNPYARFFRRSPSHRRGHRDAASDGVSPGARAADERVFQLRHFAVDHLHSLGRPHLVSPGTVQRGRGGDRAGLAGRQSAGPGLRGHDGPGGLCLSDGRRAVPLGVDPRRPRMGMGDGVVQPGRIGHRSGRRQRRARFSSASRRSARGSATRRATFPSRPGRPCKSSSWWPSPARRRCSIISASG